MQIVIGTLSQSASVDLRTVSQSATGEYIEIGNNLDLLIMMSFSWQ